MNSRAVFWLLGCVLLLMAVFMVVPAVVSAWYGENDAFRGCLWAVGATAIAGGVSMLLNRGGTTTREGRMDYFRREGLAAVGLSWFFASVAGALPFLFSGAIPDPVDAVFESVSGITTTGSTILTGEGIAGLPKGIAFWRSFTHWLGGIGIVLVFVLLFPTGGRSLFRSEVPGISREAVQQKVRDSALGLVRIYVGLTLVEVVLLWLAGLDVYDSFLHAFGTLATGGFSNYPESVLYFGSWKVELILVVFMFAAGINFGIYDMMQRQGIREALRYAVRSSEVRAYFALVFGSIFLITIILWFWGGSNGDPGSDLPDYTRISSALRDSSFKVVSLQTSTGYGTVDFDRWPEICRAILMVLAVCGGCAGSTGGGLKVVRFLILAKAALQGVQRFARPRAIHSVRLDGHAVDDSLVAMTLSYCGLWFVVFTVGTLLIASTGIEPPAGHEDQVLLTAATSVLATLNNIGPGLAAVGPHQSFAFMPDIAKLLFSLFMILGRLEFYAVVVLFVPRFWRS